MAMATVRTEDATLHVEVDGEGDPVTIFAHGLTNNRMEMAMLTPFLPGTKVRFDFRGHGRSSAPETGYGFPDFARDLDAVATAYGATRAVGTSLGQGAICNLIAREPDRFERLIFVLPAALDVGSDQRGRFLDTARILEELPHDEAIATLLEQPDQLEEYVRAPWVRQLAEQMWAEADLQTVARAIRGVIETSAVESRDQLRAVTAPTLILCREGDPIHPVAVGEILAEVMPNAELISFANDDEILAAVPMLLRRAAEFLA
jgi:3-oxoadipate enol-lactonase